MDAAGLLTAAPSVRTIHDSIRERHWAYRASVYGLGFLGVEYASGELFRRTLGEAPWDYSEARYNLNGLVRPDYFFQWAAMGLAMEALHDRLVAAAPESS